MDTTYVLTQKIKNKKYIVATWKPDTKDTCLALADDCFEKHGFNSRLTGFKVDTLNYVQSEKMYNGFASNCITINDTVASVDKFKALQHIEFLKTHYPFYTMDEILLDHPNYNQYLTEEA
jgi:hypothetical protein